MGRTKEIFAKKMALIRKQLSFRDFAVDIRQKTGVSISHSTLHDYENTGNDIMPKSKNLEALASYAGKSLAWFLEEMEYENGELVEQDALCNLKEESGAQYITHGFAGEVARLIAEEGADLTEPQQTFLLNMIKTYIASVAKQG